VYDIYPAVCFFVNRSETEVRIGKKEEVALFCNCFEDIWE